MSESTNEEPKFRYTEIFQSLQGEGTYTGRNTIWIRLFLCNFSCPGFSQKDPTDPSTYELPHKDYDVSQAKSLNDLPVFDKGCDSAYSWAKKYKHLAPHETASEIVDKIEDKLRSPFNPDGKFRHEKSGEDIDFCMTGGEPMLSQNAMLAILKELKDRKNLPKRITVETNGTQSLKEDLRRFINLEYYNPKGERRSNILTPEWFWSASPKLFHTSGEKFKRAIKPEILKYYSDISNHGHLKFVVNGTQETWDELDKAVELYRDAGITWPVYIMPVGATREQQEEDIIPRICDETLARGYHISARVHCYLYGNVLGT